MNIKKFFVSLFAAIVVTSVCVFVSCEVGLGPAVDTRPPSIVIEKPEVDKVIRNKFVISGTWEDDGTIDSVYVLLKRTDGKLLDGTSLERKVEATFTIDEEDDEKGTWQAIVDPLEKDNQIIDGSYQATVYIQDKGNHTTSQITTFTIDNTAPVLILSKPNSTPEDQTLSAYGQRLFLEGSIADSTKETWIQLDFYSGEECTEAQYLTTIETEMISPTDVNSNNARLAIYNTDLTQKYASEYYKLYGKTEKSGAEQVYAKITVYDTAETCSEDGEGDALTPSGKIKGNASQSFYLTKKLAESITKSQTANGYGLAPIDIYNVLNGTYVLKNESRAADAQSIKDELLSDEQKKSISVFTINPENSPYFTISGLKTLNLDGKDFEEGNTIVNGTQTLEVSVFMGSDSIALKDDENFYVYLLECDKYGKPVKEDVEENRIKLYSKYKETGSGSEKKIYYKVGGKTDHKTSSGAYVFSIPMNKSLRADPDAGLDGFVNINLEYGKNYIIRVSGKDTEGNDIETTDNGYGFCFTAGGTAPRITITEPADNTVFIKKGDGLHVKGSVTSEGGEPRFTISNEANMVDLPLTPTDEGTWTFEKQIAPDELGFSQDESVIYSLIFSATRDATESTQTKSVWYDVEGPAITLSDPVPLVKADTVKADGSTVEKDSVNGKVTFSGSIIDEFDSRFGSASWKVEQNGALVTGPDLSGSLEKNFTFQLDTTKLVDNKEAVVVISAYDFVGNLSETRYTCWVDQSTDVPKIVTTEEGKDISENADLAFVQQGNNLYQRGGSLVLSITDDDGVANARVKIQEYNNGTCNDPDEKQDISYPSPSFISHVLPNSVGIYRATVTVYDKHYVSESATQNNYKQIQFFLRVTGTGPDVSITPDKEYINNLAGGKYVLTFKVTNEGNKPYMLKMGTTTILEDVDEDSFTYEITPATTASIKFTVIDKNSSFTEKTFVPRFDSETPSVSIKNYPSSPSLTEDTTYLFKGDMSDTGNSGIDKVQIKFVDGEQTSTDDTGWTDCTAGSVNWNSELTWANNTVFDTEGKKTVFVKAIDGAGNEATDYKTFTYDKSKPVLTLTNPLSTSETNIISDEVGTDGYVLSGTLTESNELAATNPFVIKVDGVSDSITPDSTGAWTYTIAKGTTVGTLKSDASVEIELTATDIANKSDTKKYIVYYDTQSPELVVSSPAEDEPVSTSALAIKGTVSDNGYGVEKVEYVLYSGTVTSANEDTATKIQSDSQDVTSVNFPLERKGEQWYMKNPSVNMPLGETEGQLTLKVIASEKTKNGHGGRTTTEYVPFYFDKANPTLTEASIGATGKTKNVGFALSGKAIDSNALASVIISWGTNNSVTLTPGEGEANEMNWSQSFVVGSETVETGTYKIADGTNEFTIVAKDITGKEKQMTRTVIVDTTKPVINATSITNSVGATIAGVSWYKNRSLSVEVTAVDANGDDGTGISMVEYSTSSDGGTTWSAWSPLSSFSNNLYKGTVSFAADGQNLKFKVQAIDVAGNESDESTITVNIDTTAPVLEALYYKKGEGTASTITSPIYIKENTKLTVYGNYKDEESGVNALTYAYGNPAIKYSTVALTETPVDSNYTLTAVTESETSIKTWRAEFTPAESGAFTVTGSNRTGDSTNALKVFDVTVDKEAPVVDNVRLVISNSDKNAYSDGSKYYVNNSAAAGKTFKISGVATDTVGVDSVELLITKNDSTTETKTPTRGGTLGQWYFDGIDLSDWTGTGASAKITVKDKAGNETIETLNIAFDVTAPSADHKIDDSLKNLEFRIGDAANDAGEPDVGGKYSDGTYGSALTMQIRGNFPDETNGSGINKFYYKTFNNEEVTIDSSKANGSIANGKIYFKTLDDLKDYVIANKTDVFSPLSTVEPKNVEYNVGPFVDDDNKPLTSVADTVLTNDRIRFGGNPTTPKTNGNYTVNSKGYVQFRTSVATNFKTTIKGFVEGKNYLVIVAEDNAGNAAVDYAVVSGITYPCYSLNVDITAPTIPTKPEGSLFTNLEEEGGVVIAGTVSDMPNVTNGSSGLKKIVFTRDGGTGSVEVTTFTAPTAADLTAATEVSAAYSSDTTLKHWEANIASLLPPSGMAIISAKVVDNAGFETSTSVATITVDTTGPSLKINSPTANAKVGTSFTISGTVDDGNGAGVCATEPMVLYYTTKTPTELTEQHTAYAEGEASITPDTANGWVELEYSTEDAALAPSLDENGSDWSATFKLPDSGVVNVDTTGNIYFAISAKDLSGTKNTGYSTPRKITVDRTKPTFVVSESYVGEVASASVNTSWFNSDTLNITGKFEDDASGVTTIKYRLNPDASADSDTNTTSLPTTNGTYNTNISGFVTGENTLKVWAVDAVGNTSEKKSYTVQIDQTAPVVQKKSKNFDSTYLTNGNKAQKFDFYINEGNSGIPADAKEYTLKLGSSAVALTKVNTLADAAATGNLIVIGNSEGTGADTKYPIGIQLGTSAFTNLSGSQPVTITVKDNAGNSSVATIIGTMDIDSTPPVPSFTSPSANSKVNKEVEIKGKITEKNGIDSITLTATYVKDDNTMTNTFTYSKDGENNTLTFDETEKEWSVIFDSNVEDWNKSNAAQTWTFSVIATDEAGNTSDTSTRNYIIDQNSDRPVIKFSNLDISSMTSSNRVWVTKEDLYASINDDDGDVQTVEVSFDGNNWSDKDSDNVPYYTQENGLSYPMPTDKDGEQTIYFRVKDAKGETFTSSLTSNAADPSAPKLAYKTTEFGDTTGKYYSVIYAKVDLGDPSIPLAYYTTATDETAPVANANAMLTLLKKDAQNKFTDELTETAKQTWKDLSGVKTAVGGTTKYIYIFAKAKDANGIDTITAKFGEDSINAVYTIGTDDLEASGKGKLALFKIDISSAETETKDYKLELKATDNASRNITRTLDMNIDKQAPKVYIDSPSANASLYGTPGVADSNVTVRGRSDGDTEHVFMAVKKSEIDTPEEDDWVDITKNSALTWNVIFNGKKGQASQTDYYEDRYNTWVDTLYGTGTSTNIDITEKPVCLYFYAIDTLGNTGINNPEKLPLTIFTQGDRPTVEITSPEKPKNTNLSTVGGIITVTGSTTIAINSVENIWLQIDPDYSGANDGRGFADDWETKLNTLINGMTEEQLGYKIEASGNATIGNAIKAGGSKTSWNRAINKNSEFNKRNAQDELINRTIAIRAYAVSASGKVSSCDTVVFTLDPNAPVFGQLPGYPLKLVQYYNDDNPAQGIKASRLYEAGLYLKGKWWLTGSVSDDSGIASITMDNVSVMNNCTRTGAAISGKYNYLMNIPLTGEGKIEPKIVATEGAETSKTSELPIVLNFDNADPDFTSTSLKTSEATQIVQSDGVYEIRGTFDDNNGSGFERIAFYVTRDGYLTDIMIPQGENIADNSYLLTGLTHTTNDNKDLYWKQLTQCKVQNGTEILLKTYTMQTLPSYVRRGAVCRINNILYRINKIESNADATYPVKLTIDSKIDDAASVTVDIALAQIIDNKVAEQGITDSYDTDYDLPENSTVEKFSNDDHDQMVERFNETSGEWMVSINSQNIKDGAITIHFVAYDKAGNVTYKSYQGVVANNAPRFAGVTFGTDVNGDGKVEGTSELKTVYTGWYNATSEFKKEGVKENGKAANGNKITTWALPNNDKDITKIDDAEAPVMTVKGKIKIIPEIVGGNNGLGWKYKIGAGNYSDYHDLSTATHSGGTDVRNTATTAFEIDTPELLNKIGTDDTYVFTFTISDKTGGSLDSTDNSTADLLLKFNVALHDGVPPTAGIKPFYWEEAGDGKNSLYYTGSGNSAKPAGHIELPKELPDIFTYKTDDNLTTGLYDVDPKVSGIVYLEGFAKDNVVVEELWFKTTIDSTSTGFVKVAVRDRDAVIEQNPNPNFGKFKAKTTLAGAGIEFISYTEETVTEGGIDYNVVHWKVAIDSAKIVKVVTTDVMVAATDVKVEVQAKDRGAPTVDGNNVTYEGGENHGQKSSDSSTAQTGLSVTNDVPTFTDTVQTPFYRMDIVPYVTEVLRNSRFNTNRARSGAVSLLRGEASNTV